MKKQINCLKAPNPWKLLSHGILTSKKYKFEISWQIWLNPEKFELVSWWIKEETIQTFKNIKNILSEIWWNLENITKVRIFLTNMDNYSSFNEIYLQEFENYIPPARLAVWVSKLPLWACVEIEVIAEWDDFNE